MGAPPSRSTHPDRENRTKPSIVRTVSGQARLGREQKSSLYTWGWNCVAVSEISIIVGGGGWRGGDLGEKGQEGAPEHERHAGRHCWNLPPDVQVSYPGENRWFLKSTLTQMPPGICG